MSKRSNQCRMWSAMSLVLIATAGAVHGQEKPASIQNRFRNDQPPFFVRAEVNHANLDYREGDALSVKVACEVDAYLYVLYQQADGQAFQIYPNQFQPDNRVKARQTVSIPATDDLFRWEVGPPFGKEVLKVIASREPLDDLGGPALRQRRFNPVGEKTLRGVELELGEAKPVEWVDCDIAINSYARDARITPPGSKRFALFIGVSEYQFTTEYEALYKKPLNLGSAHHDARELAEIMQEVGHFNGVRLLLNKEATRAKIEESIITWLPSVSRPGDTILIYFAGHGSQLPDIPAADAPQDESDKQDEILVPHDYISKQMLDLVANKLERHEPVDITSEQVDTWKAALVRARAQNIPEGLALSHATGISDDLFGHWLQRLDGRQVIVIMDACHSGGFAVQEKGFETTTKDIRFDFLEREVVRLRDMGQRQTALMTACRKDESALELVKIYDTLNDAKKPELMFALLNVSQGNGGQAYERASFDHGLLTFYLLDALHQTSGPLTIEQSYKFCSARIQDFNGKFKAHLEQLSPGKPIGPLQIPLLYANPDTPFYLKP